MCDFFSQEESWKRNEIHLRHLFGITVVMFLFDICIQLSTLVQHSLFLATLHCTEASVFGVPTPQLG